jgi:hypothetical protein
VRYGVGREAFQFRTHLRPDGEQGGVVQFGEVDYFLDVPHGPPLGSLQGLFLRHPAAVRFLEPGAVGDSGGMHDQNGMLDAF